MDWGCFGLVWHGFVAFAKPLLGACPRARGRCTLTIRLVRWSVALWLVSDDGCGNPYLLSDDLPTCYLPASLRPHHLFGGVGCGFVACIGRWVWESIPIV